MRDLQQRQQSSVERDQGLRRKRKRQHAKAKVNHTEIFYIFLFYISTLELTYI